MAKVAIGPFQFLKNGFQVCEMATFNAPWMLRSESVEKVVSILCIMIVSTSRMKVMFPKVIPNKQFTASREPSSGPSDLVPRRLQLLQLF